MRLVPPNNYQHEDKKPHPPQHCFNVFGDESVGQHSRHLLNLVADTNKHERCEEDVEKRLTWNEHQNSFGVMCEPNMVLSYKQLKNKPKYQEYQ